MRKTLLLLCILIACENSVYESDKKEKVDFNEPSLSLGPWAPDPVTMQSYSKTRKQVVVKPFQGADFQAYFPVNTFAFNAPPAKKSPLVLILHGYGYSKDQYDYLQHHLGKNGFISVSMNWNPTKYQENADPDYSKIEIKTHINYLYSFWNYKNYLTDDVILIGHSRGGAAIIRHAESVKEFDKKLLSLISLAPKPFSYDMNAHKSLYNLTKSALFIYGSQDPDVWGSKENNIMSSGFMLYDWVGNEKLSWSLYPQKDFVYIKNLSHAQFTNIKSQNYHYSNMPNLDNSRPNEIIGYINAHLQLYVNKKNNFDTYFKYQRKIASGNSVVIQQHQDKVKRVLANFQNNSKFINTSQGSISRSLNYVTIDVGKSWDLDSFSPHDTYAMKVKWNKTNSATPYLKFMYGQNGGNISSYKYFSFRAAQLYQSTYNKFAKSKDFYIRLRDKNNNSYRVKLSQYGNFRYPFVHESLYTGPVSGYKNSTKNAMMSFLIPLNIFQRRGVDLKKLKDVTFQFAVRGHEKGEILIDNLEFYK